MKLKNVTLDQGLFWFQLFMGTTFIIPQAITMRSSVEGLTMVLYLSFEVFLGLNLILALKAYQEVPSVETKRNIIVYVFWLFGVTFHFGIMFGKGDWTSADTCTTISIALASVLTVILGGGLNPTTKGILAFWCKAVPQCYLAILIYRNGGHGLAAITILAGHATVSTRIALLTIAAKSSGWNRNVLASLFSEIGNELSWMVVTGAWAYKLWF